MRQPAKILLLDTGNEWGGGTNSMFEFLKRVDRSRYEITCCFYKNYSKGKGGRLLSDELADIDIPLIILPPRNQPLWAKLLKEIVRGLLPWSFRLKKMAIHAIDMTWRIRPRATEIGLLLKKGSFDLLYMNNQPSTNLEGYLAAEMTGVPVIQHCRIEPTLLANEIAVVDRIATRIICVSKGVANVFAEQGVTKNRLRIVYNGIDSHITLPLPAKLPPNKTIREAGVVGTVGQLTERKGIMHLLHAVARLKADGISVTCIIVGEGPQRANLEITATQLGLQDRVFFVGFHPAPLSWIQIMDVCVLCSSKEGLPRFVLEAMLAGKPVVGSDVVGTRELVVHGETGLLYTYGNVTALTGSLRDLLSNDELRRNMGEAGRKRVAEHYSIETYVAGVMRVFAEVLQ